MRRLSIGDGVDVLLDIAQIVVPFTGNALEPDSVDSVGLCRGKHQDHINRADRNPIWHLRSEAMERVDLACNANCGHGSKDSPANGTSATDSELVSGSEAENAVFVAPKSRSRNACLSRWSRFSGVSA